jgi:hypothetical protein
MIVLFNNAIRIRSLGGIIFFLLVLPFISNASSLNEKLFQAIKKGDCNAVKSALNAGASINAIDTMTNETPLFCAIDQLVKAIIYIDYGSNLHEGIYNKACDFSIGLLALGTTFGMGISFIIGTMKILKVEP